MRKLLPGGSISDALKAFLAGWVFLGLLAALAMCVGIYYLSR